MTRDNDKTREDIEKTREDRGLGENVIEQTQDWGENISKTH